MVENDKDYDLKIMNKLEGAKRYNKEQDSEINNKQTIKESNNNISNDNIDDFKNTFNDNKNDSENEFKSDTKNEFIWKNHEEDVRNKFSKSFNDQDAIIEIKDYVEDGMDNTSKKDITGKATEVKGDFDNKIKDLNM
ncbi:hypothetical protein MBCUT_00060 [Methanobrevibacter cuticularis]|uniref:Uncharacterized protein n=1 Tax=Methanobrevibacter cuticularis TaxID=47311 RepID=A0A166CZX8_9EURY|nr:hypothetical protein [Methanobrevibacter cuticularis]KZX17817.1 hypothetical protein MBCUT_00060 [Methanobrevibacter cuticularis]